jgi:hypothetical protein
VHRGGAASPPEGTHPRRGAPAVSMRDELYPDLHRRLARRMRIPSRLLPDSRLRDCCGRNSYRSCRLHATVHVTTILIVATTGSCQWKSPSASSKPGCPNTFGN